jgi:Ca2+-binding EF-hand superfamily protein
MMQVTTKMRNSLFHMIRVLHRRGFNIEEYCRMIVSSNIGMMQKNDFSAMLRNIGLPFSTKDLNEIAKQYAVPPKLELVDFESFLSDAGIKTTSCERNGFELDGDTDLTSQGAVNYHARALFDLKEMLIETVESLGQQIDDIYRMFARWDSDCSGSITATQFLRVLMRLHLDLPDQDQDFLVDLLDTTSMGRIEYESLLDFCFAGLAGNNSHSGTASYDNRNPQNLTIVADDNAHEGEGDYSKALCGLHITVIR